MLLASFSHGEAKAAVKVAAKSTTPGKPDHAAIQQVTRVLNDLGLQQDGHPLEVLVDT